MILEAQRVQIAKSMEDQDQKYANRFGEMDRRLGKQDDRFLELEAKINDLTKEVRMAPRSTTASTREGQHDAKYRWTLLYMGVGKETPGKE